MATRGLPSYDAIVLAGGRARRLDGASKPEVQVAGLALIAHVVAGLGLAERIVVAGPPSAVVPLDDPRVSRVSEDPSFGGPVAGIDAALALLGTGIGQAQHSGQSPATAGNATDSAQTPLRNPGIVVVLACDVPGAGRLVPDLLAALTTNPQADGACARLDERTQWLVGAYRTAALKRALTAVAAALGTVRNASVREMLGSLQIIDVADPSRAADDVDTWQDVTRIDNDLHSHIQRPTTTEHEARR